MAANGRLEQFVQDVHAGGHMQVQSNNNNTTYVHVVHNCTPPAAHLSKLEYKTMPSSSAHFVGREGYMEELQKYFVKRDDGKFMRRTCILYGTGGIGKTQICLRFIEENSHLFSAGKIFWIDATSKETAEASLTAISSVPVAKQAGIEPKQQSVLQWLSFLHEEWLLVFDGADHDHRFITEFLPAMNRGNVLVSTRNSLMRGIAGKTIEIVDMSPTEAIDLLLKSALPSATSYTQETKEHAAAIAEELCYMPLAVDQAGAVIASCRTSLPEYLSLFRTRRRDLFGDSDFKGQSKYGFALDTTWDISLKSIRSQIPARRTASNANCLLEMFSFMHYEGISEEFFQRAALSQNRLDNHEDSTSSSPSGMNPFLSDILTLDVSKQWNSLIFRDAMRLLLSYSFVSLVDPDAPTSGYHMHRLVHTWIRDQISQDEQISTVHTVRALFELAVPYDSDMSNDVPLCRAIFPHVHLHSDLVQQQFPDWTERNIDVIKCIGEVYMTMGYYGNAMKYYQQALQMQQEQHCPTDVVLRMTSRVATMHFYLGEYPKAKEMEEHVLETRKTVLGLEHPETLRAKANLANTCRQLGEHQRAKEMEEQVLEGRKKVLGSEHLDTLRAMAHLAVTLRMLGEYRRGKEIEEQVLEAQTRLLGSEHPETLRAKGNLATTCGGLGEYQRAKEMKEQVLEARARLLGSEHPDTLRTTVSLANTCWKLGEYQRAKEMGEQVLEARTRLLGSGHPDTLCIKANLASACHELGEYQRAKEMKEQVLEAQTRLLGSEHPDTLLAKVNLASTHSAMGNHTEAAELLRLAIDKERDVLGPDHPRVIAHIEKLRQIEETVSGPPVGIHNPQKDHKMSIVRRLREALTMPRQKA